MIPLFSTAFTQAFHVAAQTVNETADDRQSRQRYWPPGPHKDW